MYKLLIICMIFMSHAAGDTNDLRVVTGFVCDAHGNPLTGATVLIPSLSIGAMTDTQGKYTINEVPLENLNLQARMVGMHEVTKELASAANDTVFVDFTLSVLLPYNSLRTIEFQDKINLQEYSDTLEICVDNWREVNLEYSQVWFNSLLLPSWKTTDSTITTALPRNADSLCFSAFPARENLILKHEQESNTSNTCIVDSNIDILSNPTMGLSADYRFIDLAELGDNNLVNWGYLGLELVFPNDDIPRILLVEYERAILLDEFGDEKLIEFPFPTMHYQTDPNLQYLLIWDIDGPNARGGDIALISLENGEYSVIDPTLGTEEPNQNLNNSGCMAVSGTYFMGVRYYITSSGEVIRVGSDYFTVFSKTGFVTTQISMAEIGLENFFYTDQFLSMNQTAVSAVFTDNTLNYCVTIDLGGNVLNLSPIPHYMVSRGRASGNLYDPRSATLWKPLGIPGVVQIDCLTGECIQRHGLRINTIVSSCNRNFLGVFIFSNMNPSYLVFEVWDWLTGERIRSNLTHYSNDNWPLNGMKAMANNGYYLAQSLSNRTNSEQHQLSLYNSSDKLLWQSPLLVSANLRFSSSSSMISSFPYWFTPTISPSGNTVAFLNGRYLVLCYLTDGCIE